MTLARPAALLFALVAALSGTASAQRADAPGRPFGEVTRGSEVGTGIFTIYFKRDSIYLSLRPGQLDRDYLLVTQISQGIGELGLDGGVVDPLGPGALPPRGRSGGALGRELAHGGRAGQPDGGDGRVLVRPLGRPVVSDRHRPRAPRDRGGHAPFFLSDWADIGTVLQTAMTQRKLTGNVSLDDKRSSLQSVHLFGTNLEADVRLTFQTPRNLGLETVADYRSIPIGIHYSLRELPPTPMRPRLADDRVGYFISAIKDFSRDTADNFFVRYVNRWRLEKRNPGARPQRAGAADRLLHRSHRPDGVASRRARGHPGMEPRVRGRRLSRRDPRARRARTTARGARRTRAIRRCAGPRTTARPTPSRPINVDPRTGEILNADILISATWIQRWRGQSGRYAAPVAAVQSVLQEDSLASGAGADTRLCRFGDGLSQSAALAGVVMAARGEIPAGGEVDRDPTSTRPSRRW